MRFLEFKARDFDSVPKFLETVHFTVAVCNASEVERCCLQGVGSGFKALLVPERLQYINVCVGACGLVDLCKNLRDFLKGEAVQELAHPNGVCAFREFRGFVKYVAGECADTIGKACGCCILFCNCCLARQVDDRNLHVLVVLAAGDSPLGCVSANVKEVGTWVAKDDRQCFRERKVGVEVVEAEPALLLLVCQL